MYATNQCNALEGNSDSCIDNCILNVNTEKGDSKGGNVGGCQEDNKGGDKNSIVSSRCTEKNLSNYNNEKDESSRSGSEMTTSLWKLVQIW